MKIRMLSVLALALPLLMGILFVVTTVAPHCNANPDTSVFDAFSEFGAASNDEQNQLSSKSAYSKHLDNWLNHYLHKQDQLASKDWEAMVKSDIRKTDDLHALMKRACIRLNFSDKDTGDNHGSNAVAVNAMVQSSEKALGKNNFLLASGYQYAADIFDFSKDPVHAAQMKHKEIALYVTKFGPKHTHVINCRCDLCRMLLNGHKFAEAQQEYLIVAKLKGSMDESTLRKAAFIERSLKQIHH